MAETRRTPPSGRSNSRRNFLRGAGLTGVGLASTGMAVRAIAGPGAAGPAGAGELIGDADDPRFTIAVIPDTQFLFDSDRGDPAPLAASLAYLIDRRAADNIAFTAHLGDIVENAAAAELRRAGRVFEALDRARMPYSVLAGNHDIDSTTDDQRGRSPYLDVFGPRRFARLPSFGAATADGYNTYHVFRAAGRQWLLLALDWRPSDGTLAWARHVLRRHPRTPAILTTHELVAPNPDGSVTLPAHGQRLWDDLIRDNDQIFLALNGHFWPAGRTVLRNTAGNDVHLHITNYQNRYYGGSGMIRLYRFDTARNTIDVRTIAPWVMAQPAGRRNHLAAREIELTDPRNCFSVPVDFATRFAGFAPVPAPEPRPARAVLVPGTVAYWRFDRPHLDGVPVAEDRIEDSSGRGNHLTRVAPAGSGRDGLAWSADHHRDAPAAGSLQFTGGGQPGPGACLRTAVGAPLNAMTFERGYTIEAFIKLPAEVHRHQARMVILSRMGTSADAGATAGDHGEPVATLGVADGLALRWAVSPPHRTGTATNWSHELPTGDWCHLAVVNDGRTTTMYVDGEPVLRNPTTPAVGLATTGAPWLLGASHPSGATQRRFQGWLGEVRIVDRPLDRARFLA